MCCWWGWEAPDEVSFVGEVGVAVDAAATIRRCADDEVVVVDGCGAVGEAGLVVGAVVGVDGGVVFDDEVLFLRFGVEVAQVRECGGVPCRCLRWRCSRRGCASGV